MLSFRDCGRSGRCEIGYRRDVSLKRLLNEPWDNEYLEDGKDTEKGRKIEGWYRNLYLRPDKEALGIGPDEFTLELYQVLGSSVSLHRTILDELVQFRDLLIALLT